MRGDLALVLTPQSREDATSYSFRALNRNKRLPPSRFDTLFDREKRRLCTSCDSSVDMRGDLALVLTPQSREDATSYSFRALNRNKRLPPSRFDTLVERRRRPATRSESSVKGNATFHALGYFRIQLPAIQGDIGRQGFPSF
ncbi:unnamed protein product [Orchesella dallaii]|uniref:Uncharacterized protein n=1 Tax=Orchesella dallaii TaxID=48710 RepID=A0ABP1PTR2_9HEXA